MNNTTIQLFIIFLLFILFFGIIIYFTPIKKWFEIKKLSSIKNLRKSIGLSIEHGKGLHISLGKSNLNNIHGAASFIGLTTLKQIIDQSILSDQPPVTTCGSGEVSLLAQARHRSISKERSSTGTSESSNVYLTGPTNMSYISGTMPLSSDQNLSTQVLVGNIGPEIGLLIDASERKKNFTLAATDSLEGQAVSFVCSDEVLIGEEIFSLPAQLENKYVFTISLLIQDILRWSIIIVIFLIALLKISGIL